MGNSQPASRDQIIHQLNNRPVVVIVGGGYGGYTVAKKLDRDFNVLLIDKSNYKLHNIGALRACVEEDYYKKVIIPFTSLLEYGIFIQSEVTSIGKDHVVITYGAENDRQTKSVLFDYCVIATGSSYAFPCKSSLSDGNEAGRQYSTLVSVVSNATNIAIIGGGPVGIELLGEIAHTYPNKKITLVHSGDKIMPGKIISDDLRNALISRITRHCPNAKLILGERVSLDDNELSHQSKHRYITGDRTFTTDKGTKIEADLTFLCTGAHVNYESYLEQFESTLSADKRIIVEPTLQIPHHENIFAIGDCADAGPMMAYFAQRQAEIAADNIKIHFEETNREMKKWSVSKPSIFVTLGPNEGASQLPPSDAFVVGSTATTMLKGKSLYSERTWKELGFETSESLPLDTNQSPYLDTERIDRFAKQSSLNKAELRALISGNYTLESEDSDKKSDDEGDDAQSPAADHLSTQEATDGIGPLTSSLEIETEGSAERKADDEVSDPVVQNSLAHQRGPLLALATPKTENAPTVDS